MTRDELVDRMADAYEDVANDEGTFLDALAAALTVAELEQRNRIRDAADDLWSSYGRRRTRFLAELEPGGLSASIEKEGDVIAQTLTGICKRAGVDWRATPRP